MMHMCQSSGCEHWAQWILRYYDETGKIILRSLKFCNTHYEHHKDDKNVKCLFVGVIPDRIGVR